MINVNLGGYGINNLDERVSFPFHVNPSEKEIDEILMISLNFVRGVIQININPEPDSGAFDLTVEYDSGNYLPLLSLYLDDGDVDVKNWIDTNLNMSEKSIVINGYSYPLKFTSRNINIIKDILVKFMKSPNSLENIMK